MTLPTQFTSSRHFILGILMGALFLTTGCLVKPAIENDDLGAEVSEAEVDKALNAPFEGQSLDDTYKLRDWALVQSIDRVANSQSVRETRELTVTKVDPCQIVYEEYNHETGVIQPWGISRCASPTPTPSASPTPPPQQDSASLFKALEKGMVTADQVRKGLKAITPAATHSKTRGLKAAVSKLATDKEIFANLATLQRSIESRYLLANPSLLAQRFNKKKSIVLEFSTAIGSVEVREAGVKYYGLKVSDQILKTKNCGQISDCTVPVKKVEYDTVTTDAKGVKKRFHAIWNLARSVPAVARVMDRCVSTILEQDDQKIPIQQCIHVDDFRWGSR